MTPEMRGVANLFRLALELEIRDEVAHRVGELLAQQAQARRAGDRLQLTRPRPLGTPISVWVGDRWLPAIVRPDGTRWIE